VLIQGMGGHRCLLPVGGEQKRQWSSVLAGDCFFLPEKKNPTKKLPIFFIKLIIRIY